MHLRSSTDFFAGTPFIDRVTFRFYPDEEALLGAFDRQEIMGIHSVSQERAEEVTAKNGARLYEFAMPRLFTVFFNTSKSVALAYDEVREALTLTTDRSAIVQDVLKGRGKVATGPFLPFVQGYVESGAQGIDIDRANALLEEKGWKRDESGQRSKDGTPLTFDLAVPDWPELMRTADLLRDQWQRVGATVNVKVMSQADLQQNSIRPREYEALLFGQGSMLDPDPYSFWHSSQRSDPGLNLAFYENKDVDTLLADARETTDRGKRLGAYEKFQSIIASEHPAIFLYSPSYLYVVSDRVQGITARPINFPSARLSDIATWYIETKRIRK